MNSAQIDSARFFARCALALSVAVVTVATLGENTVARAHDPNKFSIMISTNHFTETDADNINANNPFKTNGVFTVDGIWAFTISVATPRFDNTVKWRRLIDDLNGASWTVSEDVYYNSTPPSVPNKPPQHLERPTGVWCGPAWDGTQNVWDKIIFTYERPVHHACAYIEPGFLHPVEYTRNPLADSILHTYNGFDQFAAASSTVYSTPLVIVSRTFNSPPNDGGADRKYFVLQALANPKVGGVVFEIPGECYVISGDRTSTMHWYTYNVWDNILAGIEAVRASGKVCYVMLTGQSAGVDYSRSYVQNVKDTFDYFAQNCSPGLLHNDNVVFVLSKYGRHGLPVLGAQTDSIEAAFNHLKQVRNSGNF